MATARVRYEIHPSQVHKGFYFVVKLKGRLSLGAIATGMSRRDAVLLKRAKEQENRKVTSRRAQARRVNCVTLAEPSTSILDTYDSA